MPDLRDEIRAILREEIAALTAQTAAAPPPSHERVRIASSSDLTRFAQDLLARAADPAFAARVARGEMRFELAEDRPLTPSIVTSPSRPAPDTLDKPLVTERDIAALAGNARVLRLGRSSRLTPLARDEARRRGIRIERSEA